LYRVVFGITAKESHPASVELMSRCRGCLHDRFGGDIAGSTRSVLDYELLAKSLRQPPFRRATVSDVPSAANGAIRRTGRDG
jgi:hypothetical protein